jgi:hypothetical protein
MTGFTRIVGSKIVVFTVDFFSAFGSSFSSLLNLVLAEDTSRLHRNEGEAQESAASLLESAQSNTF